MDVEKIRPTRKADPRSGEVTFEVWCDHCGQMFGHKTRYTVVQGAKRLRCDKCHAEYELDWSTAGVDKYGALAQIRADKAEHMPVVDCPVQGSPMCFAVDLPQGREHLAYHVPNTHLYETGCACARFHADEAGAIADAARGESDGFAQRLHAFDTYAGQVAEARADWEGTEQAQRVAELLTQGAREVAETGMPSRETWAALMTECAGKCKEF